MTIFHIFKNKSGSATIVVLGLAAVIGFGFNSVTSKQLSNANDLVNERAQRFYVEMYRGQIESILRNPQACNATFAGTNPTGAVPNIRLSAANIIYTTGQVIGQTRTNAARVTLERITWATTGDANGKELEITFSSEVGGVRKTYDRSVRVNYILSGSTISNCAVSDVASLVEACTSFNGTLVNSICSNPRVAGNASLNGTTSAVRAVISSGVNSTTMNITGAITANALSSNGASTMASLSGPSLNSSRRLSTNSISVGGFPICAQSGCQTWTTRTCPPGRYMYAINSNETISCAAW